MGSKMGQNWGVLGGVLGGILGPFWAPPGPPPGAPRDPPGGRFSAPPKNRGKIRHFFGPPRTAILTPKLWKEYENRQKIGKKKCPILSRLGELLNTLQNVHPPGPPGRGGPRGSPREPPLWGSRYATPRRWFPHGYFLTLPYRQAAPLRSTSSGCPGRSSLCLGLRSLAPSRCATRVTA